MTLLDESRPHEQTERVTLGTTVHDIDVAETHNFVANGLVTHNSIYSSAPPTFATSSSSSMTSKARRS